MEILESIVYFLAMAQTLEQRVKELERRVAELTAQQGSAIPKKDWGRTIGVFKNDEDFEEAVRLGREYREQQTYEKEIAAS